MRLQAGLGGFGRKISLGAIAFLLSTSAQAAEVSCLSEPMSKEDCSSGMIRGEIVKGDYSKVERLIGPSTYTFYLISSGGDVDEAMKIGRLFRRYLISVSSSYYNSSGERRTFQRYCRQDEACV